MTDIASALTVGNLTAADATTSISSRRAASILLVAQFVAMWTAFFILMPAIDWPASLGLSSEVILPLILEQSGPVFLGYTSYLIHALLLIPIAALLPGALGLSALSGRMAILFGGLAGFAKALGITRWIFLMPMLAATYVAPEASESTKDAISAVYQAFNAYAGGVGEILGVGLFAGIWTILLSITLLQTKHPLLGYSGIAAALLLFSTLPSVIGIESPILLTLSGIACQLWTLALAISLWRRA